MTTPTTSEGTVRRQLTPHPLNAQCHTLWPATPLPDPSSPYLAASHEASPCSITYANTPGTFAGISLVRRNDPYAILVVHPAYLFYQPLPGTHMLPYYQAPSMDHASYHAVALEPSYPPPPADGQHPLNISTVSSILPDDTPHTGPTAGTRHGKGRSPQMDVLADRNLNRRKSPPLYKSTPDRSKDTPNTSASTDDPSPRRRVPRGARAVDTSLIGDAEVRGAWRQVRVQFAQHSCWFSISAELAATCPVGSVVIVEGDRGVDAGTVGPMKWIIDTRRPMRSVLRLATQEEVTTLHENMHRSEQAAELVRRMFREPDERLLNWCPREDLQSITVHACEYQFDRQLITIYYDAPRQFRFKNIAPELFRCFHCRIWMNQKNYLCPKSTRNDCDTA